MASHASPQRPHTPLPAEYRLARVFATVARSCGGPLMELLDSGRREDASSEVEAKDAGEKAKNGSRPWFSTRADAAPSFSRLLMGTPCLWPSNLSPASPADSGSMSRPRSGRLPLTASSPSSLRVEQAGGQRSKKRKSPCVSTPKFRSPLSRMLLSPRMYLLGAWLRSPSMRHGSSPAARRTHIDLNVEPEELNLDLLIGFDRGQDAHDTDTRDGSSTEGAPLAQDGSDTGIPPLTQDGCDIEVAPLAQDGSGTEVPPLTQDGCDIEVAYFLKMVLVLGVVHLLKMVLVLGVMSVTPV